MDVVDKLWRGERNAGRSRCQDVEDFKGHPQAQAWGRGP